MVTLVTTFSDKDYENIGRKIIENWLEFTEDMNLCVVMNTPELAKEYEKTNKNFKAISFQNSKYHEFVEKYRNVPEFRGIIPGTNTYEYRLDIVRFCHKIFAIEECSNQCEEDKLLIWWDSDAFFTEKIDPKRFEFFLKPFDYVAAYLGRKDWDHSETGFIAFNLKHHETRNFIRDMVRVYEENFVFQLKNGRTDSFVFDVVKNLYIQQKNVKFRNISENAHGNDVWYQTFLHEFSVHHKGIHEKTKHGILPEEFKNFHTVKGNDNMRRYGQILKLIEFFKTNVITEIGVASGNTAVAMIETALNVVDKNVPVVYFGFDLFEDIDEETNKKEFNSKKVLSKKEINDKLIKIQEKHRNFFFALYKGNTNETLKKYKDEEVTLSNIHGSIIRAKPSDSSLVFIDGGHSVETIRNDYENFKNVPLIILDDYYVPDNEGRIPDITKVGCNFLENEVLNVRILPIADPIREGGLVKLMVCGKLAENIRIEEGINEHKQPENASQLKIQTKNAIPNEELQRQVDYTCRMMKKFNIPEIPECELHDTWAYMVGGSPSYQKKKYMDQLKNAEKNNALVFTSKTAHDYLISKGIVPWACILLDPRPHVASSFKVHPNVLYIVASQVHPDVIDYLTDNTNRIMIYHAAVAAGEDEVIKRHFPNAKILPGGSTSQTRGMMALMTMGFYKFKMFGIDSSYENKPDVVHGINKEKKAMEITVNDKVTGKPIGGKSWWVDPELIVQCNDMEYIMKMFQHLIIDCQSEGLMKELIEHWKKNKDRFVSNVETILNISRKSTFKPSTSG